MTGEPVAPKVEAALSKINDNGWAPFWGGNVFPSETELQRITQLSAYLLSSKLVPSGLDTAAKIVVVMLHARENGIPPMMAMKGMYPVKGKVSYEGWLALSIIRSRCKDARIEVIENTASRAEVRCWRPGYGDQADASSWSHHSFSMEEAKVAGLLESRGESSKKSLYLIYPKVMLMWRVYGMMSRFDFGDILHGAWLREEIEEDILSDLQEELKEAQKKAERMERRATAELPGSTTEPQPKSAVQVSVEDKGPKLPGDEVPYTLDPVAPAVQEPAPPSTDDGLMPTEEEKKALEANQGALNLSAPKAPVASPEVSESEPTDEEIIEKAIVGIKTATPSVASTILKDVPTPLMSKVFPAYESRIRILIDICKTGEEMNKALEAVPEGYRSNDLIAYYRIMFAQLSKGNAAKPVKAAK